MPEEESFQSEHVAKGALYLTLPTILGFFFSFLFYILIARVLAPTEIGKLSILLMISAFFSLTNLSINFALQRFIPTYMGKEKHDEIGGIIRTSLILLLSLSALFYLILLGFSSQLSIILFGTTLDRWPIIIMLSASFALNLVLFFNGEMLGFGMYKQTAIQNILNTGISRVSSLALAALGFGLIGVSLGWLIAAIIAIAFSLFVLRGKHHLIKGFSITKLLKFSLPVHVFTIIMFVQGWADVGVLYAFGKNLSQIGIYYLVISGTMILSIFYTPIGMAIFPALSSRYSIDGPKGITTMVETYLRMVLKITIPIGFSFAALSMTAIETAFGRQYISGAIPFSMLAATSFIPAILLLIVTIIQSSGNTKPLVIIGIISSISDILLVAVLAGPLGGIAGAIGRITFSIVGVILGVYFLRNKIKLSLIPELKKPLLAAATIATPLLILDQYLIQILNLTLRLRATIDIFAFLTLALVFIYFTNYFTKEDFNILKQAFPSRLENLMDKLEHFFT